MSSLAQIKAEAKRVEFVTEIAQREFNPRETMRVLTHNQMVYFSWGVSKKVNYYNKALMLQVNGRHHKGKVWITLAWDDTYTVHITTNQQRVVKKYEGVYFDMLTEIIDNHIERIPEYR